MKYIFLLSIIYFSVGGLFAQDWINKIEQPVELGQVNWLRDYDTAIELSAEKDLPIFIFFQEVPGCMMQIFSKNIRNHHGIIL